MSLLVSDAYNQIEQELNLIGQQLDQSDIFLYLQRAVNYFSTTYQFPTCKTTFNTLVFNGVRQYSLPSDFATLIEPQRFPTLHSPTFQNNTSRELYHWPYGRKIAVEYSYDLVTPFLDISDTYDGQQSAWSTCDGTTNVAISGDGSDLSVDNMVYTEGTGSLRFKITPATGQTVLTFSSLGPVDVTDWLTRNWNFLDLILLSTNTIPLTNVKLRLGNDAANYYEMTVTADFLGNPITANYHEQGFDFRTRTTTGTVTNTNIVWMQVVLNYPLTLATGYYNLDNIFSSQGTYFQIPYYSKNNILSGGTTRANTITALTDVIALPVDCEEAIIYKVLELAASSPNVANQNFANYAARELKPREDLLKSLYPIERILVQSTWYKRKFKPDQYYLRT